MTRFQWMWYLVIGLLAVALPVGAEEWRAAEIQQPMGWEGGGETGAGRRAAARDRLPYVAIRCNTLQYVTLRRTTERREASRGAALRCHTLPYVATHCTTLPYVALRCVTLRYAAIRDTTLPRARDGKGCGARFT